MLLKNNNIPQPCHNHFFLVIAVSLKSTMVYTAIDTFYLTDKQLKNTPSRKDGIDEATEMALRRYGCDLIQESDHNNFNVKRVAATCIWLASKLEENIRTLRRIIYIFHIMECRRENLPLEHLDTSSKKYLELEADLKRCELQVLKEMGYICHVELPHKFMVAYLEVLEAPHQMIQEAWNIANDSMRTTLCVQLKSHVVACGVIYTAARRCYVHLPENPPWWELFDSNKKEVEEVCRVVDHLYSLLPKPQYIPVCKEDGSFTMCNTSLDSRSQPLAEEGTSSGDPLMLDDANTRKDEAEAVLKSKEHYMEPSIPRHCPRSLAKLMEHWWDTNPTKRP
ncbi:unnamed protein product [Lactuca saligna]|uniref:Cyclin-like domain-containing protein n=1 Tax=Lactuca saligna TaxID=75948 RepID=A0AA36EN41_LACSI|nr:unnamed protein product [Lactuca saligna]